MHENKKSRGTKRAKGDHFGKYFYFWKNFNAKIYYCNFKRILTTVFHLKTTVKICHFEFI